MSPPFAFHHRRSIRPFAMAAAAALISFIPALCNSRQQPWTSSEWEDNALNTIFNSEGSPRYRISSHQKMKKIDAVSGGNKASDIGLIGRHLKKDPLPKQRNDEQKHQIRENIPLDVNHPTQSKREEKKTSGSTLTQRGETYPGIDKFKLTKEVKKQIGKRISGELTLVKNKRKEQTDQRIKEDYKLTKEEKKQHGGNTLTDDSTLTKKEKKEQIHNEIKDEIKLIKKEKKEQGGNTIIDDPTRTNKQELNRSSDESKMKKKEKKKIANVSKQDTDTEFSNLSKKEKKAIINSNSNSLPAKKIDADDENTITDLEGYDYHGWWRDDFHTQNDDDDGEICFCEDDYDYHRRYLVKGYTEQHEMDRNDLHDDGGWSDDDAWIDSFENVAELPLSTTRALLNFFGILTKQPIEQIKQGNLTTLTTLTKLSHRHHKGWTRKGSKSSKSNRGMNNGKKKGGKTMKKSSKSGKHESGWKSSKSSKYSKSSKSSKPCKCHPITRKPIKSRRPTRPPRTEKPQHNILPKPTTRRPTNKPARMPTQRPTKIPKPIRTGRPSNNPTRLPTPRPTRTQFPTKNPTMSPSQNPFTTLPTNKPSVTSSNPSHLPTTRKTRFPTNSPSGGPSRLPTSQPTFPLGIPSKKPTQTPTNLSKTLSPTFKPTQGPISTPTKEPIVPIGTPSRNPTKEPTSIPTSSNPTKTPTNGPTVTAGRPSTKPTEKPTSIPITPMPQSNPTHRPSETPTTGPPFISTGNPTRQPTHKPSHLVTPSPTVNPTKLTTKRPSQFPTLKPTSGEPSKKPTRRPTSKPTTRPTNTALIWLFWGAKEGIGGSVGNDQSVPEQRPGEVICVVAGPRYSLLIDDSGAAFASGFIESKFEYLGQFGVDPDQLSEGSNTWKQINTVVNIDGDEVTPPAFAKVYAGATGSANSGEMHSVLIDEDGFVYTTGNNNRGQLCLGDSEPRYIPHRVKFDNVDTPAIAAAIGEDFTLVLLADGKVYGCGSNEKGELGLGSNVKSVNSPSNIDGLPYIVELSAGLNFALFHAKNGKVYSSGSNIYMQQCEDSGGEPLVTPQVIQRLREEDIQLVIAGKESSYFLLRNGIIKACGRNDEGQLGDGSFVDNEFVTVDIPNGEVMTGIGSGPSSQSAFFFGKSSVFGAGANDRFQLGIGEIGSRKFPVEVKFDVLLSVDGIEKISSSGTHSVANNCPVVTERPTRKPTQRPTLKPNTLTMFPTRKPTEKPTMTPTNLPTQTPTVARVVPTLHPTGNPIFRLPSRNPTDSPTKHPRRTPSNSPVRPSTYIPTSKPTPPPSFRPTNKWTDNPTLNQDVPTRKPSTNPTDIPTTNPTKSPTYEPTNGPTHKPTNRPTKFSTGSPKQSSTPNPTNSPTVEPSAKLNDPTHNPTVRPTKPPTVSPTVKPTQRPTADVTVRPTQSPTLRPSQNPTVSPTVCDEIAKTNSTRRFEAFDPVQDAQLGFSTDVYNKTVVVGAPFARSSASIYAGGAYVYNFNYDTKTWEYVQKMTTPASVTGDRVGFSVSIAGRFVVLGSPYNRQFANASGAIYIYDRGGDDSDTFAQKDTQYSPSLAPNCLFGWSVSTNSNGTIAVGAKGDRNAKGSVYIFKTTQFATWTHVFTIEPDDITASPSTGGNFGWNVVIDAVNTVVVGAPFDVIGSTQTGSVSVYKEVSENKWELFDGKIAPVDGRAGDQFGVSVDADESTIVIGSSHATVNEKSDAGAVYVYDITGKTNFVQKLISDLPSASAKFGESVSISEGRLVVGAPSSSSGVGNVYLYHRNRGNDWILSENITPLDAGVSSGQGIKYGQSVAISVNALVVGAPENDVSGENTGSVFIYDVIEEKCDAVTLQSADARSDHEPLERDKF